MMKMTLKILENLSEKTKLKICVKFADVVNEKM
jgi:hypothetical protein